MSWLEATCCRAMPSETLALLADLNIPSTFIMGNGDREVLEYRKGNESAVIPEQFREIMRWVAGSLDENVVKWISTWPMITREEMQELGDALFCH